MHQKPDSAAWERLVSANENRLYRAALSILGSSAEAEDAVQDAFVKYLEKRPRLSAPEDAARWLMRVTVNGCKDRLRSAYRRRSVPLTEELATSGPEERQELEELLSLEPRDRLLIHLYYYEGYSTAEIAGMTGQREGTVRSRLSRVRAQLRTLLSEKE